MFKTPALPVFFIAQRRESTKTCVLILKGAVSRVMRKMVDKVQ